MPASEAVPQKQVFILRGGVIVVESLLDKSHFIHCIQVIAAGEHYAE